MKAERGVRSKRSGTGTILLCRGHSEKLSQSRSKRKKMGFQNRGLTYLMSFTLSLWSLAPLPSPNAASARPVCRLFESTCVHYAETRRMTYRLLHPAVVTFYNSSRLSKCECQQKSAAHLSSMVFSTTKRLTKTSFSCPIR